MPADMESAPESLNLICEEGSDGSSTKTWGSLLLLTVNELKEKPDTEHMICP
eukprot:CAMPEP_0115033324 /NCGR_PEP_ID=MMETSP0216-20121206/39785_1 /TAXON_ID=223996 /ORGANISM="Protocruzia adherens, Strain Boccale" /LENGTH=51 /DNA_ID=CAMNT_0002411591 /DNA_START=44 /DNA_END=195 /DNA_ORIENTATION=+